MKLHASSPCARSEQQKVVGLASEIERALLQGLYGRTHAPIRTTLPLANDSSSFLSMPAVSAELGLCINKTATVVHRTEGDPRPTVHAVVTAFSTESGELLGTLDGNEVTRLKCAAVSALVTHRCTPEGADVLAIAGAGVQARQQALAVCAVRPIREVRLWARRRDRAEAFAGDLRHLLGDGVRVRVFATPEEAARRADVVSTATSSNVPLARFSDVLPTAHFNCMGGHTLVSREVPHELLQTSTLIVEDVATAVAEAGAVHAHALSLAELVNRDDRRHRTERTVFSSTGHAFLDLVTVAHLLGVRRSGVGRSQTMSAMAGATVALVSEGAVR